MRKWLVCSALVALIAAGCTVVVTPTTSNGWFFLNEGASGSGHYVYGPGTPPAGRGSALLTVDGTGREAIATAGYAGLGLSGVNVLQYSTYQAFSGTPSEPVTLAFDVDYDSLDSSTAYQGRLVFVPSMVGSVTPKTWQTWDALTGAGWYSSASDASPYRPIVNNVTQANPPCNQTTFCSWSQVMAAYPRVRIRPSSGLTLLRAGGPVTGGMSVAVDHFRIGVGSEVGNIDFEPGTGTIPVKASTALALGFGFAQETGTGSGAFVTGPAGADGTGSAQLTVNATGGEALGTGVFAGSSLSAFNGLSYKTYSAASGGHAPSLQIDVDYDATDNSNAFQGRAVFEPELSGGPAVANGTWQTWNPLTAASGWWQSGTPVVNGSSGSKVCTQASPCSFATLMANYPNASVRPVLGQLFGEPGGGGVWLKAGGGWSGGWSGNVDSLSASVTIGANAGSATYDLEP